MADVFSAEKRSQIMGRVRGSNTKPEVLLRSMLHRAGYRFTVNGPKNRKLPGKPDIVLPRWRCLIFVHGCFWHGHEGCKDSTLPTSRRDYWEAKIGGNMRRDGKNLKALKAAGWNVITIWTCQLATAAGRTAVEEELPGMIGRKGQR